MTRISMGFKPFADYMEIFHDYKMKKMRLDVVIKATAEVNYKDL